MTSLAMVILSALAGRAVPGLSAADGRRPRTRSAVVGPSTQYERQEPL